jgi:hypothetical protein
METNLYKVKSSNWNGGVYVASNNQFDAASLASSYTNSEHPETCTIEYIGSIIIDKQAIL